MKALRTTASIFGLMGVTALCPSQAFAQQSEQAVANNDVIIVTAQRRAEAQVDVPISITSISSDALSTANVTELADIAKVTPALRFDSNGGGFVQPSIRGIGTAVTTSGGGANVGIYVDGFYSPNPLAADFDLLSVDSIQVLKGPQGTLFGRNTTGGAILVTTREPSTDGNTVEGKLSFGRYNEFKARSLMNFAVSDRVAFSVEGQLLRGDGWQHDISTGKRVGDYENWGLRVGMKADLTDSIDLLVRWSHSQNDDPRGNLQNTLNTSDFGLAAPFGGIPGTYTTDKNKIASGSIPEFFRSNSDVVQVTLRADLGFADLTSLSQYRNEKVNQSIEIDYSGLDILQLGLPNNNETWSQEFLLNSKPGGPLQWTAGLFYFENSDQYLTFIDNLGSDPNSRIRFGGSGTVTRSYAAFLDATYEVMPQLFVTAGVRYARDQVDDAYFNTRYLSNTPIVLTNGDICTPVNGRVYIADCEPGAVAAAKKDKITPRIVLRYKLDQDTSIYASYTKGYKAAIMDVGGTCQNSPYECNRVKPESIDAFEVGAKYSVSGLSLEAAAFYYDYKDLQVSLYEAGTAAIVNAANSRIYGLEGQFTYKVTPHFQLNGGASWVHARYRKFDNAPVYTRCSDLDAYTQTNICAPNYLTFLVLGQDIRDSRMQRTPEFTGSLGARYGIDIGTGELALSGNLYYTSSFYFGPSGTQFKQDGYETLSLRAQWNGADDRYFIALWGDNVTNSRYVTLATYSNYGMGATWNSPVTYGVEVGFKF
ncbi:TonB-dependent receptor [Novosphingobium album (ex Hu et al. 2023)]|uniref:TonB-dependent receptor n=1 Tax=Novosphingobium album (ex Hu et al. 2023) TaxID=2930093 RepID=A0ABT0AXJ6_9SPHN|nr:TonB-dependent receptor [Novosphingobium album (ex Hu et al. 2023)]MCJ2177512.1 TonB-dependent receptor [Novosphingobium album (ex Hu et al. 2023)]